MTNLNELRQELRSEIVELDYLDKWQDVDKIKERKKNIRKIRKELKAQAPEIVNGGEYTVDEFGDTLGFTGTSDRPKKKFLKEPPYRINEEELEIVEEIIRDNQAVYNYINKFYDPENIRREKLDVKKEKVKSSNIYDVMGAEEVTTFKDSFEIPYKTGKITLYRTYSKDTTISQSDIASFMRF